MNFRLIFIAIIACLPGTVHSQGGTWVWMNGNDSVNKPAVYGTQGIASATTTPGGLYEAACWTDLDGNFWIFGGIAGRNDSLNNDLWKYDPNAYQWTWIKGPGISNQSGVYGNIGVPDISNIPGARGWGAHTWTDNHGDLWLFGGSGFDSNGKYSIMNDLWRYHINSNEWTCMNVSDTVNSPVVYGTLLQPSDTTTPGARQEGTDDWVDSGNNLWFWGSEGGTSLPEQQYSDMWKYSVANNTWTWMSGLQGVGLGGGSAAPEGVESPVNRPTSRSAYTNWQDNDGYFYLFAGWDYNDFTTTYYAFDEFSEVWRYNPVDNYWSWVAGDFGIDRDGYYDQLCSDSYLTEPGARFENRTPKVHGCVNALLCFGGFKDDLSNAFNDLWVFNPKTWLWKWVGGSENTNDAGHYGVKGIPDTANNPHARGGHCAWYDNSGNLWIFGGMDSTASKYNDMWKFIPDSVCLSIIEIDTINVTSNKTRLCIGDSAYLCAPAGFTSYFWNTGDTAQCIYTNAAGNYTVTASGGSNCISVSRVKQITIDTILPAEFNVSGDTLSTSGTDALTYQWYLNGSGIPGATSTVYITTAPGSYNLEITDTSGCVATSMPWLVSGIIELNDQSVLIYPNPANDNWHIKADSRLIGSSLEVFNTEGKLVYNAILLNSDYIISAPDLANGVYELRITSSRFAFMTKLVKI